MPKLIRAKRVSNYELFFDLALVLAIGQLTSAIHLDKVGWWEIFVFITTNLTMLNIWNNEVHYYNKYGDSRRIDIYTVIPLMFIMGNLALNLDLDFTHLSSHPEIVRIFNTLLSAAYAIIALQYYLKGKKFKFTKDHKVSIAANLFFALSTVPFILGLLPVNYWSFLIFFLPSFYPLLSRKLFPDSPMNFPHAVERAQLVTILTFGEAVIAIITTYPLTTNLYQGALLFWGMALMFMFYMTQTFLAVNHHRKGSGALLFYSHVPIFIGINFFTVGLEFLADHHHAQTGFYMFITGVFLFFLGTLVTTYYNQKLYRFTVKEYSVFALILLAMAGAFYLLATNILLLSTVLIIGAWIMSRYYMYTRRRFRERHNIPHPDSSQNPKDFA